MRIATQLTHITVLALTFSLSLFLATDETLAQRIDDYLAARARLVEQVAEAVKDPRVLDSIGKTERHKFVSPEQAKDAYHDMAMPIGYSATISPPGIVGFMTEQLDPQPTDKVLEIGTGSGYQAAILSPLVAEVYTIEIIEPLGRKAAVRLEHLGYKNVHCKIGDGFAGWAEHAPFDKIIVTCSPEKIPTPLVEQLREGGMMVIPLGDRYHQSLCLVTKKNGELKREVLESTFFIPMTGKAEDLREGQGDDGVPRLENGGIEELTARGVPHGWYYLRQAEILTGDRVYAGKQSFQFLTDSPERTAHALQAFGADGRRFKNLHVSLMVRTNNVSRPGKGTFAGAEVYFYDDRRAKVGGEQLGPWSGTSDWSHKQATLRIPPRARLAVIGIGMFGVTGEMLFDDLEVKPVD